MKLFRQQTSQRDVCCALWRIAGAKIGNEQVVKNATRPHRAGMNKENDDDRDNFSPDTLRTLAGRAGYMCSMPGCKRLTVGPSDDRKSGLTNVGVGAHITAASAKGPRYDKDLTPNQRTHHTNGIWTCQTHGKDIDDNTSRYTVDDLKRIKAQHEEWVYRRLSNGPSHIRDGMTYLRISNIGPFREEAELKFGRLTVLLGNNGKGKTALCEAIAAFSGDPFLTAFLESFGLGSRAGHAFVEAGTAEADVLTKVRLAESSLRLDAPTMPDDDDSEPVAASSAATDEARQLLITVNDAVAPTWPLDKFPIILLREEVFGEIDKNFQIALQAVANQFRIPEDLIWNTLKDEFFASTFYPCRFRRTGAREVEIALPGKSFYLPPENLSRSEQVRIILALVFRICAVDKRRLPWLVLVDSSFASRLDNEGLSALLKAFGKANAGLQLLVSVVLESDADLVRQLFENQWLGATGVGELTAHAFL